MGRAETPQAATSDVPMPRIRRLEFKNFKALRDTGIALGPVNIIVGPNGSGKSTVLQAVRALRRHHELPYQRLRSLGTDGEVRVRCYWDEGLVPWTEVKYAQGGGEIFHAPTDTGPAVRNVLDAWLGRTRTYAFQEAMLAGNAALKASAQLGEHGEQLVVVLDDLRDRAPERFEELNRELHDWLPEFDRILFSTTDAGTRSWLLRSALHGKGISADQLSQGTLFTIALLTLAHIPEAPPLVGLEEPDRGIHPRMLRRIQDAIYRLANPSDYGDKRAPVQVIATTHSPYFLDLFKDHPEEIVIAEKRDLFAELHRLSDRPDLRDLLKGTTLGEAWYSGVLGGVPAGQ
jgi:predicted ATPase